MTNEKDVARDEPLEMVAVAGPAEAQMIAEILRNNGIECTLQGDVVSTPWPTHSDLDEVRVLVQKPDSALAQELIEGYFTPVAKDELDELTEDNAELGVDDADKPGGFAI
jgi:hypothetical protein